MLNEQGWWTYEYCHMQGVKQVDPHGHTDTHADMYSCAHTYLDRLHDGGVMLSITAHTHTHG